MNRTGIFLAAAGALALVALVLGLPKTKGPSADPRPLVGTFEPATASDGSLELVGRLSHPYVEAGRSELFVTVDVTGAQVPGAQRAPVNLAVVIDRSGSMSGEKLNQAKQAAKHLVSQLRPVDRLTIVHYGSDVQVMPGASANPANKERMLAFIDAIFDDGGTNIGAALAKGRDQLLTSMSDYKVNRMILISDGEPTEGMTDQAGLTGLARDIRQHGVAISAIGVGTDFNEDLMQAIAELGAGAYAFLSDASQLSGIFQKDLQQASTTVARGVELWLELPAGVELGEVYGYRAVQAGRTVKVPLTDFSAGQTERVVARVVVNAPEAGKSFDVAALKLEYLDLLKSTRVASAASLAATSTDNREVVLSNRDKDATVYAARAMGAWNLNQAAEHLKKGDPAKAKELLLRNTEIYQQAAAVAPEGAMAEDLAQQAQFEADFDNARDEGQVQQSVKAAKRASRVGFGLLGSTY